MPTKTKSPKMLRKNFDKWLAKQGPDRKFNYLDHITGKIRSILCRRCNLAIGFLKDSAKLAAAATAYLIKHGNP